MLVAIGGSNQTGSRLGRLLERRKWGDAEYDLRYAITHILTNFMRSMIFRSFGDAFVSLAAQRQFVSQMGDQLRDNPPTAHQHVS